VVVVVAVGGGGYSCLARFLFPVTLATRSSCCLRVVWLWVPRSVPNRARILGRRCRSWVVLQTASLWLVFFAELAADS
jgi:hypothetical protein